jgi:hypothetical protein
MSNTINELNLVIAAGHKRSFTRFMQFCEDECLTASLKLVGKRTALCFCPIKQRLSMGSSFYKAEWVSVFRNKLLDLSTASCQFDGDAGWRWSFSRSPAIAAGTAQTAQTATSDQKLEQKRSRLTCSPVCMV